MEAKMTVMFWITIILKSRVEDEQNLSFPWYFPRGNESDEDGFSYGRKSDSDVSDDNNVESGCKNDTDRA